jgi:curved DNA-binding protein CbpA
MEFDPYSVLGVRPTATADEIRRAYLRHVRLHHPDTRRVTQQSEPSADEPLRRVMAAYALLRDPERRARYDRALERADSVADRTSKREASVRIPGLNIQFRINWLSD